MRPSSFLAAASCAAAVLAACNPASSDRDPMAKPTTSFYDLEPRGLSGEPAPLESFRGKVALVVNVASECGLTPQYAGLEALHRELSSRGFTVLAFPSNDFGGQEPGSPDEIRAFCDSRYQISFPLFEKVETKPGPGQSPVYAHLGSAAGALPGWNFGKYLVGRDGAVLAYFDPRTPPDDSALRASIEQALG